MSAEALRRIELRDQLAQALALLALDAARDAGLVGARQQHQVAAGQRVEGGQRRRLVGELLLGDLDEHLLARLEHVADARGAVLAVARRPAAARMLRQVAEADLVERQEGVAFGADVDEGGLERRVDAVDDALVDVALEVLATEGLDLKRFEHAVGDDPHSALFRVGHVDQHDLRHQNSSHRPLDLRRRAHRPPRTAHGGDSSMARVATSASRPHAASASEAARRAPRRRAAAGSAARADENSW